MYRQLILAAMLGLACTSATPAYQLAPSQPSQQTQQTPPPHDDHLIESGSYVNKAGNTVHRPAHIES